MRHPTLSPAARDADLGRLDDIIAELESFGESGLLREHLRSARQYLSGAMAEEYLANLERARRVVDSISDGNLQKRVDNMIAQLIAEINPSGEAN
jgi:hypothetical protein